MIAPFRMPTEGIRGFARETMFSWPLVPMSSVVALNYGKALVEAARRFGAIPVYGTNGQTGWHSDPLIEGPTVILGRKGMGNLGVEWCETSCWVIDTAYYTKFDISRIFPRFFYFFVKYVGLNHLKDGTSNPSLSRDAFGRQWLPCPPLPVQKAIAALLGAIDDKIELNRQTNETLEAMARAIFKDWFVDFGPTRAKMEGRAPYLTPDIWSLFPDRLDDEGKPEGWELRSIYECANVIYGAPFSSKLFNTERIGRPLIRIRDLADETPGIWTPEVHSKGYTVTAGDIVVGMDGEFRAHLWGGDDAWLNQRVCVFVPKRGISAAFVCNSILDPLAHVEATEIATTVIHLGKNDIDRFRVVMPRREVIDTFGTIGQPLYDRIVANKRESRTLAAIRDLLLPKLMSGEIRVRDAEKVIEEVA